VGVLKHLLFWPVTGPIFLMNFSFEKVAGVVQEELTDDSQVKSELLELQLLLELGDIDDDEYVRRESLLMYRLREIREWRERFGMGVSGGPVRVQAGSGEPEEAPAPAEDERVPQVAQPGEVTIDFKLDFE
jgi:hypothetical protein